MEKTFPLVGGVCYEHHNIHFQRYTYCKALGWINSCQLQGLLAGFSRTVLCSMEF